MAIPKDRIQVQMFNVGFGDAFLVILPGPRKVLIDCGTIAQASIAMSDVVERILEEVRDQDGICRIDVVIATHRHRDHVSGFADPRWHEVEVGEVWMPWTEDPKDARTKHVRETQSRLAVALSDGWNRSLRAPLGAASEDAEIYQQIALNALSNAKAMSMLHKGFAGSPKRRFLHAPMEGLSTVPSDVLGKATAYVLGPSLDEAVIRDMNPPEGATYLSQTQAAVIDGGDNKLSPFEPFEADWGLKTAQYRWQNLIVNSDEVKRLKQIAETDEASLTVSLDKAVNGTSLVLVFELRDAVLLFPGDAQWGTWDAILRNSEARELVSRATFLKVGHHGSHNATPREFLADVLAGSCCSMVSTLSGKWTSIPRKPLMDALAAKTLLTRSDEEKPAESPIVLRTPSVTIAELLIQA